MNVYRDLDNLPAFKNAVLTIGSFDGVHHGHQQIIHKIKQLAREIDGESIIITFHPHPRQVVYPRDQSLQLLSTIEEKVKLFEKYKVDNVVVVPFTVEFSQLTPDEYIEKFLIKRFNPRYIVIGYDHRFGINRQGDINFLKWYSTKANFEVIEIEKQKIDDIGISSSKIRQYLEGGHVKEASKLLGHYYSIRGTVIKGQGIGRQIGFPTANIKPGDPAKLIPPHGIYAVYAWYEGERHPAMLYIGNRPTLGQNSNQTIEVNLFDFNFNIYDNVLEVELVDFIRNDEEFQSMGELAEKLKEDKESALRILSEEEKMQAELAFAKLPSVDIVILNYNGQGFLKQFLPGILGTSYQNIRIWVADNCSTDGSCEFLKTYYPNVELIELEKNYGFAEGYNQAIARIDKPADYYVLLNSDIEVTTHWLQPMINLMEEDKSIAACQPKILSLAEKNKFEYAGAGGGWIDSLGYPFCRGRVLNATEVDNGQYDDISEVFWASGAAMVIRSDLFQKLGGFDGDYFAHMEEIDLCWRLRRAGYKIMVCPASQVFHHGGGTLSYLSPRKSFLNFRNSLFTIFKNEKKRKLLWLLPLRLVLDGVAAILFLLEGKSEHIRAVWNAHMDFYKSLGRVIKKRKFYKKIIKKNRIQKRKGKGIYHGSIIIHFYLLGNKTFSKIVNR